MESPFEKIFTEMIHYEEEIFPPCWVPNEESDFQKIPEQPYSGLWRTGPQRLLAREIINSIDQDAQKVVCVASFLLSEPEIIDALIKAAHRRVRVYILTTSAEKLEKMPMDDQEFEKKVVEEHKEMLNRLAGKVLVRTAPHFHTKFVLVDPPMGPAFLLTANVTYEALARNPEIGVKVSEDLAAELYVQFRKGFWLEAQYELLEPNRLQPISHKPKITVPPSKQLLSTSSGVTSLQSSLLSLLDRTNGRITLVTFGIEPDHEVTDKLHRALSQGRKLQLLVRTRPAIMETIIDLAKGGAEVYGHRWLHAKALWADSSLGSEAIIMTANIGHKGLAEGFESGIHLAGKDAERFGEFLDIWIEEAPFQLAIDVKRGDLKGNVKMWENNKLLDVSVEPEYFQNLGAIEASAFEELETTKPKSFPNPRSNDKVYHVHRYQWIVTPPKLPKDAKRDEGKYDLPIFDYRNEKFVVIKKKSELKKGEKLAKQLGARIVIGFL